MIKIDENDPIGEMDPSFPFRDVVIRKNTDMKEFYDLQKEIGRGKFGTVYRCTEKSTGLKLAAKFIGISKRQDRRNAEREVEIMRELQHPRLIQMYDAFEINNIMCVVLELIEGGELFERVIDDDFILTEKSVSVFMRQICEGIAFIHSKNILHLDMKPENILCLTRTGNRIKIIDFGLARKYDPEKKLQVLFGTPEFVAPEVVNFDSIGFGTDMWSVGVICYVLLSGLSPFMGETDVQTMANVTIAQYDYDDEAFNDISADAKDFIGKLLLKDREQRMSATECLSHRWLQRRKPPVSRSPPCNPIPQSELDLQKDTLRYLVDRWNNDSSISLVLNNEDDKCEKVIDICKVNGITEQPSKSRDELVSKMASSPANNHTSEPSVIKLNSSSSSSDNVNESSNLDNIALVPIQSIEAPPVSNQVLKSLSDVTSTSRLSPNLKRSLSPDTVAVEAGEKEHTTKISKSLTPSRSGSSSPIVCEKLVSNVEIGNIQDESSQELPKSPLLEVPGRKSPLKQSSNIKKSPSASPKLKKKTTSRTSSPAIDDHLLNGKDEPMNYDAEIVTDKPSEKLPKSPSLLEVPGDLSQVEPTKTVKKSPSTSPKPLKKIVIKTPSPTIKDQNELILNHIDSNSIKSSQQRSEEQEKLSQVEPTSVNKSPSASPIPSLKTVVRTPSPTGKDQASNLQNELISNHNDITNEDKSSLQKLEMPKTLSPTEPTTVKKSPSPSPIPLKKTVVKTPSPTIKEQSSNPQVELMYNHTNITNDKPNQQTLEVLKNLSPIEPRTVKKSPSTSPTPLKKTVIKTPSPTINDLASHQHDQHITNNIDITNDKSGQLTLEIPKDLSQVEPATVEKSPSTSTIPMKKTVVRTPSPTIKDQSSNEQDKLISNHSDITNAKPSPLTLKMPKNLSAMEPATMKKSPSTSPTPLKKAAVNTPSPTIKDQSSNPLVQSIDQSNTLNIKFGQELSTSSLLEVPKKSPSTDTLNTKKSPSTSPKPLKKKVAKTPSPSIKDQPSQENVNAKSSLAVTPERSPQRDILKDEKSPITVPHGKPSPKTDAQVCDIVKEAPTVDETNILMTSKHKTSISTSCPKTSGDSGNKPNTKSNVVLEGIHSSLHSEQSESAEEISRATPTKSKDKLQDIPSPETSSQSQPRRTPIVEISDETYECVKKRRFTIKSVESTKTIHKDDSTSQIKSTEKTSLSSETTPTPHRRSIFSPDVSPKVLRKLSDFMSTSELMKRRISDISNLLSRRSAEQDTAEQSIPDDMSSFCSKLNRIVRLRHDSYSIDGSSSHVKRPKFRISYLSRDVPLASTPPLHADLLNYLPFGDETISTPVWSFQRNNPFHSDPSSLRNSPERFASPSLTRKLLSKFFNDSLDYDISPTPSTSTNGLPKDKITGIIS